jgi:GNAT superfamily N-acetyltransferase
MPRGYSAALTATFGALDWEVQNGVADPFAEPGVCTLMGPAVRADPYDCKHVDIEAYRVLQSVIDLFRRAGYTFSVPADFDESTVHSPFPGEREKAFLFDQPNNVHEVTKDNDVTLQTRCAAGWLYVRCEHEHLVSSIQEALLPEFRLARIHHTESLIVDEPSFVISIITGSNSNTSVAAHQTAPIPTTMFYMKKGATVIAKAACIYYNYRMNVAGPTLERMETASQWQNRGYATRLLEAMEDYYTDLFRDVTAHQSVRFNISYITGDAARSWFEDRGYEGDSDSDDLWKELQR